MRAQEKQAIEAVSDHLANLQRAPDPHALARVIGTTLGATGCALTIAGDCYRWGHGAGPWLEHTVEYGGQPQGILAVAPESAGPVAALAAVLGAPLAEVRLAAETDRLRRDGDAAAHELVDDRWRATVEMEQERRGLERDLHDGAQHHLVALRMALALVEHAGAATEQRLDTLMSKLDTAEKVLVGTAAGILPIALATEGLAAALKAELAGHEDVMLNTAGLRHRYAPLVESTVYFACLEAVNNAHKHAPGASIAATVRDSHLGLEFVVSDDGPGFTVTALNSGLPNLSARLATVGGTVTIRSAPGRGTTITGFVPR
ncbi:ATP-binding protein [Saccharopolyspora sp. NPDC050389]|uniref:sensor histidine kinase n=1 Tax=Saccharopolyspora sp. NPDC050389 TaxID=3155516 RepID=UPI0033D00451